MLPAGSSVYQLLDEVIQRDRALLAAGQVLDLRDAGLEVAVAEHDRGTGPRTVGGLHRTAELAVTVGHVDVQALRTQRVDQDRSPALGGRAERHDVDVAP